jgi:hypothetical protein
MGKDFNLFCLDALVDDISFLFLLHLSVGYIYVVFWFFV